MNIMRPDIHQKLKDAIAARLKEMGEELGITHDNELPDYIMVLLANKKNQRQIENDLRFFLNESTSTFTAWLTSVVNKLESLSTETDPQCHPPTNGQSRSSAVHPTERRHVSPLVSQACSNNEPMCLSEGEDFPDECRNRTLTKEEPMEHLNGNFYKRPSLSKRNNPRGHGQKKTYINMVDAREIINSKTTIKDDEMDERDDSSFSEPTDRHIPSLMNVIEKHPQKEKVITVPSLVRVTPRPVRPPELQPSTNLILKAVKDAEKSVATVKPIQRMRDAILEQRMKRAYKPEGNSPVPPIHLRLQRNHPYTNASRETPSNFSLQGFEVIEVTVKNNCAEEVVDDAMCIGNGEEGEFPVPKVDQKLLAGLSPKRQFDRSRLGPIVTDTDSESPRELSDCIVTSSVDDMDHNVLLNRNPEEEKGQQVKIRCRFWPKCELGKSCRYHHPSVMCRVFPKCKFGDNCAFIHPNCKFGKDCLHEKCIYTHPDGRIAFPSNKPLKCMFYPNCSNQVCPYLHVRAACRYGSRCTKQPCEYDHSGVTAGPPAQSQPENPFKWSLTKKDF